MSDEIYEHSPERIKEWLERQGHSLEMRVAKAFREKGFTVSQYEHYIDPESQLVRQVDVVASLSREIENCFITARLFIECKYAKARPWIILITSQKFDSYAFFSRILRSKQPSDWKNAITLQERLVLRILLSLNRMQEMSPFNIEAAGYTALEKPDKAPTQRDNAFEATVQVSKSVEAHDIENEEIFINTIHDFETNLDEERYFLEGKLRLYLSIAFPVIVINGQLFESHLGDDNEIKVSEIENGVVFVPYRQKEIHPKAQVPLSPVHVVTEEKLGNFIIKMQKALESMIGQDGAIQDLMNFEQSKITRLSTDTDF
jgi:hypothetical protein